MLSLAEANGRITTWDVTKQECLSVHRGHEGKVNSVALSDDGSTLASGGMYTSSGIFQACATTEAASAAFPQLAMASRALGDPFGAMPTATWTCPRIARPIR